MLYFKFQASLFGGALKRYGPRLLAARGLSGGQNGYEVVVAGGGIMGCSSAYHLARRLPPKSVCVVERDRKVSHTESALHVGPHV